MPYAYDPSTMSTGLGTLDDQHKRLFKMVNDLEAVLRKEGASHEQINQALQAIVTHTKSHFSDEERIFDCYTCPARAENRLAHEELIETLDEWFRRYQDAKEDPAMVPELVTFLGNWFTIHICRLDVQLRPCVQIHKGQSDRLS